MKYNYYQGLIKERISKLALLSIALLFALTAAMGAIQPSMAASHLLDPFTEAELDTWVADRQYPSGDVKSVSFDGRDNVAKIGVVGSDRDSNSFKWFEGIKKIDNFGTDVQVDLYVPAEWENAETSPANVGFWASDDPITAYPLIVFRNGTDVDAGFYTYEVVWDGSKWVGVYNPSEALVNYNGWNTLKISLDVDNDLANYFINGEASGEMYAGSDTIGEVFLNHYNDGVLNYTAHWHVGVEEAPEEISISVSSPEAGDILSGTETVSGNVSGDKDDLQRVRIFFLDENNKAVNRINVSNLDRNTGDWSHDFDTTELKDGEYSIRARAVKFGGGQLDQIVTDSFYIDNTGPEVSYVELNGAPVDNKDIRTENCEDIRQTYAIGEDFEFSAVIEDELSDVASAYYRVFALGSNGCSRSGDFASNRANLQYDDGRWQTTGAFDIGQIEDDGKYTIVIVARDSAGNTSNSYVDLLVDNTSPRFRNIDISPVNNNFTSGDLTVNFEIHEANGVDWDANRTRVVLRDASGDQRVDVSLDESLCPEASGGVYACSVVIDTNDVEDGNYRVTIQAQDIAGNFASTVQFRGNTLVVDNTNPRVRLANLSDGDFIRSDTDLTVTLDDRGGSPFIGELEIQVMTGVKSEAGSFSTGSTVYSDVKSFDPSDAEYVFTLGDLDDFDDELYRIRVRAYDEAGNRGRHHRYVYVDNTKPSHTIDSHVNGELAYGAFTLEGTATDNLSGIQEVTVQINEITEVGGNFVSVVQPRQVAEYDPSKNQWTFDVDVSTWGDGVYRFNVNSVDNAGNVRFSPNVDLAINNPPKNALECFAGGWSGHFRNHGHCVSTFATQNARGNALGNRR